MNFKAILCLILMSLFVSACQEASQPAKAPIAPSQGTISGGGGFADTSAIAFLDLAKYSLAEIIQNSSDQIYSQFPEGKGKHWLVEIIKKIKIKNINEQRYGRDLKFNYDLKTQEVYATKTYVHAVASERLWMLNAEAKLEVLLNLYMDILHEVSHFYGIGISEASDSDSDAWARQVLFEKIGTEKVVCLQQKGLDKGVQAQAFVFNPSTGFSYYGKIEYDNQWEDAFEDYKSSNLSLIVPPGRQYESEKGDYISQYYALVNLALKHMALDDLKDVVLNPEDLSLETVVDLEYMESSISTWSLSPLGHISDFTEERIQFTAQDGLTLGSNTVHVDGTQTEEEYFFVEKSIFDFSWQDLTMTFEKVLMPTDKNSESYLKVNFEEMTRASVVLECEYFVDSVSFK